MALGGGDDIEKEKSNIHVKGLFEIRLFCWNWKLFIKSTVDKC